MIFLSSANLRIGRAAENDVVVTEDGVSREHAVINWDDAGYSIVDLGSRNGTFVNGARLDEERHVLENKDRIQLGGVYTDVHWVFMRSPDTVDMPRGPAEE